MTEKPNTYAELEKAATSSQETTPEQKAEPIKDKGEIDLNDFSDTAIGDKVK